jgi:quercetin dioxygenase-like cupin family protein
MAHSLRLVEYRLEPGELLAFTEGPRVIFVRAGALRVVGADPDQVGAQVGEDAAIFAGGACGVQSYREALSLLVFELLRQPPAPARGRVLLEHPLAVDPKRPWLMRCDRVDFVPGAVAPPHGHKGGGIRCLLRGALRVTVGDAAGRLMRPGDAWFESGREPVLAEAAPDEATSFVRCAILPAEIRGESSIVYRDPADAARSGPRTYTMYVDEPISWGRP